MAPRRSSPRTRPRACATLWTSIVALGGCVASPQVNPPQVSPQQVSSVKAVEPEGPVHEPIGADTHVAEASLTKLAPDDEGVAATVRSKSTRSVPESSSTAGVQPRESQLQDALDFEQAVEHIVARDAEKADFRAVREALARDGVSWDSNRVIAALVLIDFHTEREEFPAALAVAAAAQRGFVDRRPLPPELVEARVRLFLDLDRLDDAWGEIVQATQDAPAEASLWMLRARCAYRRDHLEEARHALVPLTDGDLRGVRWVDKHRDRVLALAEGIRRAEAEGSRQMDGMELLAKLRSSEPDAPSRSVRVRALAALLSVPETRWKALTIALLHSDARLRVRGLRALQADDPQATAIVTRALNDEDPLPRGTAARAAPRLELGPDVLLARLELEDDPYAFRCLHESLRDIIGPRVDLPHGGEQEAATRSQLRTAWRETWTR